MRHLRAFGLLLVLSVPCFAGDINSPGYTPPPPPPCENCMTAEETEEMDLAAITVLEITNLLSLIL